MRLKSAPYRFFALIMAFLMFCSSVGFSMDMHFCQGQLKSISLIGKAKNCHEMAQMAANCRHHQKMDQKTNESCSPDKKDCCQNRMIQIESDDNQRVLASDTVLTLQLQDFVIAFAVAFSHKGLDYSSPVAASYYKPPLIPKDIPVLIQSFLL